MMPERIRVLCSLLERTDTFADVGCDHGYCTAYLLRSGLCAHAIISDVSAGSLAKAEALLSEEIARGQCRANLADGLDGIPPTTGLVLIAGMGGREIVGILERGFLPKRFVLQPMRDAELLRRYLVSRGAAIERDFTFRAGRFYHVVKGAAQGGSAYTEREFRFGRDNVREGSADFSAYLRRRIGQEMRIAEALPPALRAEKEAAIAEMRELL